MNNAHLEFVKNGIYETFKTREFIRSKVYGLTRLRNYLAIYGTGGADLAMVMKCQAQARRVRLPKAVFPRGPARSSRDRK